MTNDEWRELVDRLNGLWPGSRPLPEEAIEAWWRQLRDYPAPIVKGALDKLAASHERRPALADIMEQSRVEHARYARPAAPESRAPHAPGPCPRRIADGFWCPGTVKWQDAGAGWLLARCDQCAYEFADPPGGGPVHDSLVVDRPVGV